MLLHPAQVIFGSYLPGVPHITDEEKEERFRYEESFPKTSVCSECDGGGTVLGWDDCGRELATECEACLGTGFIYD
jgi:hypothetical protein